MNQTDARALLIALNNASAYVPPMIWQNVTSNPILRVLEHLANAPPSGEQQVQNGADRAEERPSA